MRRVDTNGMAATVGLEGSRAGSVTLRPGLGGHRGWGLLAGGGGKGSGDGGGLVGGRRFGIRLSPPGGERTRSVAWLNGLRGLEE